MPFPSAPNTVAVGNAIVAYGSALTYPNTSLVYTLAQLGAIKDVTDQVATGGACLEVHGNLDDSQRHAYGGRIWDEQSWYLLSLVSNDNATSAETLIYNVRDALVQPFQVHATLGGGLNVFHAQIKPGTGRFTYAKRNGITLRVHLIELLTKQEWQVPIPPGVTA